MKVRGPLVTVLCPLRHVLVLAFLFWHDVVDLTQIWGMSGPPGLQSVLSLACLLYTSPSPRDKRQSRMPSSA